MTNWSFYSLIIATAGMATVALSLLSVMSGISDPNTAKPILHAGAITWAAGMFAHKLPIKCLG